MKRLRPRSHPIEEDDDFLGSILGSATVFTYDRNDVDKVKKGGFGFAPQEEETAEPPIEIKPRVFIAGPYSKPSPGVNTNNAIQVANILLQIGMVPFVPHLSHFWNSVTPKEHADWIDYDNQWLSACDAVIRMKGESEGADKEVELAEKLGIPVFTDLQLLGEHFGIEVDLGEGEEEDDQ